MFQKQTWLVFPLYFIHIGLKGNIFMYSMEKCPSMEIYEVDTFYGVNVKMVPTNNTDKDFFLIYTFLNVQHVIFLDAESKIM